MGRQSDRQSGAVALLRRIIAGTMTIGLMLPAASIVHAACSRPIVLAYGSPQSAKAFAAAPARHLKSFETALADASGCSFNVVSYPTARLYAEFRGGHIDVLAGALREPGLDSAGEMIPALSFPWLLIMHPPGETQPKRLEDFLSAPKLLIGQVRGLEYPADIGIVMTRLGAQHQLDESVDFEMALTKLDGKRDAAVLMNAAYYLLEAGQIHALKLAALRQPQFAPVAGGSYVSNRSLPADDRNAILVALKQLTATGLQADLYRAHLTADADELQMIIDDGR
jgi:hypothetical protein